MPFEGTERVFYIIEGVVQDSVLPPAPHAPVRMKLMVHVGGSRKSRAQRHMMGDVTHDTRGHR